MQLRGLIPAAITPMTPAGEVDWEATSSYLSYLANKAIGGIAINTDAGEGPLLDDAERERLVSLAKEVVRPEIPVICGLAGSNTREVLARAARLKDAGADAFLVFPHTTFRGARGADETILSYHRALSEAGYNLVLFQLQESLGGCNYPDETLVALLHLDGVVAIKEASFDPVRYLRTLRIVRRTAPLVSVLSGNDNFVPESFILGGDGALIGLGAVATGLQCAFVQALQEGNARQVERLGQAIQEIADVLFVAPVRDYRARTKALLVALGWLPEAAVRAPLQPVADSDLVAIHRVAAKYEALLRMYGDLAPDTTAGWQALRPLIEAVAARIFPAEPGELSTQDLGVASYICGLGGCLDTPWREIYRRGLRALEQTAQRLMARSFLALSPEEQDAVLRHFEATAPEMATLGAPGSFFTYLVAHVREGLFSDPSYGGNREKLGWKLLGYPDPVRGLAGWQHVQWVKEAKKQ
jgi:4-hydroxy-tetrahydrodipicolinate synthase